METKEFGHAPKGPDGPVDSIDGELAAYLGTLQRDECFRVERVLKESPVEVTQLVYFEGTNGSELGPFVRKLLLRDAGVGEMYRRLFELRRSGRR